MDSIASAFSLYWGCALTNAPEAYRLRMESAKGHVRKLGIEVLDFLGLTEGTPEIVVRHDISCVERPQLFVANCDYPSIGLGCEVMHRVHVGKRLLALAHKDVKLTRFIIGLPDVFPDMVRLVRYQADEEILSAILEERERFEKGLTAPLPFPSSPQTAVA